MRIARWPSRFWAVYDDDDELVCVTVYKKGAKEVVRRLSEQTIVDQSGNGGPQISELLMNRILRVAGHACECRLNPENCESGCPCTACKVWWELSGLIAAKKKGMAVHIDQ